MCLALALISFPRTAAADYVRIKGTVVNVRQGPGTSNPVLFQAEQGEEFDLVSIEGLWCRIRLESGQEAWVFGKLVSVLEGDRPGMAASEQQSEPADESSEGLSRTARLGIITFTILVLCLALLKRKAILRFTGARLRDISGYKREQAFRYDNRKPSDDSWEL